MSPQALATDDIDARIEVWAALSELYLDTDVGLSYDDIACSLAASPFSIEGLQRILIDEVHPALHSNLLHVAGEWAGFERSWLIGHMRKVCEQALWRRRLSRLSFGLVRDDWRAVETRIRARREA